jgi:hypothetical protein
MNSEHLVFRTLTVFLRELYQGKSLQLEALPQHPQQSGDCCNLVRMNQALATLSVTNHQIVVVVSDLTELGLKNPSAVTSINFLIATNP